MIFSENPTPKKDEFNTLITRMDALLNTDASEREDYYISRSGKLLEQVVFEAIKECAIGTEFHNTIQLVSGSSFPDIVANNYYGIEVKSTEKNHWTSIGSSILESTRIQSVRKIYLTFGKLGKPVKFISRPYEECLSGIAVTHYPRYQIDMNLGSQETIFNKMGITYDELRLMDNPVAPVSRYYKSKLKPGESLWWTNDDVETSVPPTVRLWTSLSPEMKKWYTAQGYALFPEIVSNTNTKYDRYALWLTTQQGIVNTNIRDCFSAGGQVLLPLQNGLLIKMPATYNKIALYRNEIVRSLKGIDENILKTTWNISTIESNRVQQWISLVSKAAETTVDYSIVSDILSMIFNK